MYISGSPYGIGKYEQAPRVASLFLKYFVKMVEGKINDRIEQKQRNIIMDKKEKASFSSLSKSHEQNL